MATAKMALDKKQALSLVNAFFQQFQNCLNRPMAPNAADFEKILARNFHISSNGNVIAKNLAAYMERIHKLQKVFSRMEIHGPNGEPVLNENKIVITFEVAITPRNGQKSENVVMAIATIEDNKLIHWEEVAHDKGHDWLSEK